MLGIAKVKSVAVSAPKSGVSMMLASMGINPEEIMKQLEAARVGIPAFAAHLEQRVLTLENKLDQILVILQELKECQLKSQ